MVRIINLDLLYVECKSTYLTTLLLLLLLFVDSEKVKGLVGIILSSFRFVSLSFECIFEVHKK